MLRIPANKSHISAFFLVTAVVLFVCLLAFVAPSAVFANHCINTVTGESAPHDANGNCPDDDSGGYIGTAGISDGEPGTITTIGGLIRQFNRILNILAPFLISLGVFIVIWGVFKYLSGSADEEKRAQARQFIVWGVVGVFIMTSVWGLVSIMVNTVPLKKTPVSVPSVFPE